MRAIRVHEPGGAEALRYETLPDPVPGPGEALLRLEAIGVNFIDIYHRTGSYALVPPFGVGVEGAGVVEAVGEGVASLAPGDRVAHAMELGAYAELQSVPAARLVKLPERIDAQTAAAALLQGMTAHYLVHSTFAVKPGHTVLVHAGAGGVGRLLIQMAKQAGARVLATVGSEAKAEVAREAGADAVILYAKTDFSAEVARLTDGDGVEVVYDGVGQATFDRSLDCLKPRGLMALFGAASGAVAPLNPQVLNDKGSLFLTRPSLGFYIRGREELEWRTGELFTWISEGRLTLKIDRVYPLADAAAAHRALEGRQTSGKLLLRP